MRLSAKSVKFGFKKGKRCSKCKEWKNLEYFGSNKCTKDKKQPECKECKKKYREEHKEETKQYHKKYREEHKEETKQYHKKYRQEHKEEKKQYAKQYDQEHKEQLKKHRKEHREQRNQHQKIKLKTNPYFRLNRIMSRAIYEVKNLSIKQGKSWKQLLPYTLIELKKHLKRTLPEGYTWEDFMQGKLDIDHILPKAIFQYEKPEDLAFQICWSLDNLRLLPGGENSSKGSKLIKPFQKHFDIEVNIKKWKKVARKGSYV